MAKASGKLIAALRRTAERLKNEPSYQWGHMGACNCGILAQELTQRSKAEIHAYAMRGHGDWSEQAEAFCPTSQMPMDLLISELISSGLSLEDLISLERLKDRQVLSRIQIEKRAVLSHNNPQDVALYLEKWAELLNGMPQTQKDQNPNDLVMEVSPNFG